jgi:hypothetical protein
MFLTDMPEYFAGFLSAQEVGTVRLLSTALYLNRQLMLFLLLPKLCCEWFCLLSVNHRLLGVFFVTRI